MTPAGVILPTLFPFTEYSPNHRLPSGPTVIGKALLVGIGNSVITPAVVILPTLLPPIGPTVPSAIPSSVNQRLPSGPAAIPYGKLLLVGMGYSVTAPAVVIFPILPPPYSVNHR